MPDLLHVSTPEHPYIFQCRLSFMFSVTLYPPFLHFGVVHYAN